MSGALRGGMAFSRRTWIATIAVAALVGLGARAALARAPDDLSGDWKPLWDRCRQAIETAKPLNTEDLVTIEVSAVVRNELVGQSDRSRMVGFRGGRFFIVERESGPASATKRTCKVLPTPATPKFSKKQLALLVQNFLVEHMTNNDYKSQLFTRLYPYIFMRFDAVKQNPNGCSTTAFLMFHPDSDAPYDAGTTFFETGAGEQSVTPCSGISRLDGGDRARL